MLDIWKRRKYWEIGYARVLLGYLYNFA
jgi:hypothetical protein